MSSKQLARMVPRILLPATVLLLACGGGESGPLLGKDEVQKVGKAEWPVDYCEKYGWYSDGICDSFCPKKDPECGAANVGCEQNSECFEEVGAFCYLIQHSNQAYDPPLLPSTEGACLLRDGQSCNEDADCAMGFTCGSDCGMGRCSGTCLPDLAVKDGCSGDWSCGEGQFCALSLSTNPNDGVSTVQGECKAKESGICNTDADCAFGQTCRASAGMHREWGECMASGCDAAGVDCGCKESGDCFGVAGAFCHLTYHSNGAYDPPLPPSTEGTCRRRDGQSCNEDTDCAKGFTCREDCGMGRCSGFCALDLEVAEGCFGDWGCDEGQFCAYTVHTSTNDGSTSLSGECRTKESGICNVDAQCAAGQTCTASSGMHKTWGECRAL